MTRTTLLLICTTIGLVAIPMILRWVPPNRWYGFRIPSTLADPNIWYTANVFAGWALLVSSGITILLTYLAPQTLWDYAWFPQAALIVPLIMAIIAMFVFVIYFAHH